METEGPPQVSFNFNDTQDIQPQTHDMLKNMTDRRITAKKLKNQMADLNNDCTNDSAFGNQPASQNSLLRLTLPSARQSHKSRAQNHKPIAGV